MMLLEPKSVCDLELGPLENLEAEGVLEPETMFELDLLVLLVLKIVSGLVLVPGMMLESMTMSELERAPEGSLFPKNVSETETIHQEWVLMREPTQKLELIPMMMRVKEFLTLMVES